MAMNRESVIRAAEKYVSKGKLEHAIKEYRKVLAENPNDANTLNRVGDLYARIERFDEAVKLFSQIAEQYTKDGFFVKAIAIYKKIIKLDPSALAVYERLAELYYKQGLLNEARTQYQVLADYYQKHDNATSATTIYQKMSQMEPENPSFHLKLAELYTGQRLIDKAMREYRHLADILIVNGSVDEATQVYEKALEVDSNDLDFVREAVSGLTDNGHEGAAAKLLARAVELNPEAREIAAQVGMGGSKDSQAADAPSVDMVEPESMPSAPEDDEDDVFTIDMDDDGVGALGEATGFGDDSVAYVPGDESPFGAAEDAFEAPETSFADVETSAGEVSFDSAAPADDTGGMTLGGDDEVFTFDLDDDEIPSSQVMPPDDLDDAPVTLDEGPEIEIDLDLDTDMDLGGDAGLSLASDDSDGDGGTEELSIAEADDDGVFDLGDIDEAPAAVSEVPSAGEEVEIDWSMDSIDDLDAGLALDGDVQPVEVEELDLGDFDAVDLDGGDETLPSAVQAEPLVEPFAPEDFQLDDAGDETVAVGDVPVLETELPEMDLGLDSPVEAPAVDLTNLAAEADAEQAGLDDTAMVLDLEAEPPTLEEEPPAKGDTTSVGLVPSSLETPDPLEDTAMVLDVDEAASEPQAELSAVQREEDLLAEASVFAKYGLKDKALDRLQDLQNLHPDHPGGLELELRLHLEGGEPQETIALANRLLAASQVNGGSGHWDAIQEELEKAGFQLVDGQVVHQPEPERPKKASASGDRIAQLLEDLSLEDLGSAGAAQRPAPEPVAEEVPAVEEAPPVPSVPEIAAPGAPAEDVGLGSEDPTVSVSRDALADAMLEVQESVNDGAAPAADLLAAPEPEAAEAGKKLFSLADELDLDDLDDEDDEVAAAPAAPAPAEPDPVDAMDETGMSWLDDVATESPQASQQVETIFDEEDDFFDLAAELERELSEEELAADDGIIVQPQEQSLEEIIEGFKQGVAENLSPEDYDTHYNLGIAYREMGLVDEAIGEFQLACKDDRYLVDCSSMLGQCFLEKGLPELAVRWYRKGLESPSIADEVSISLLYEMGNAYLSMGDQDSAYKTFVEIYGLNSNYRDVANKLQDLQGAAPS